MSATPSTTRRWMMLVASIIAAMASTCSVSGAGFLIPELHSGQGLSIGHASLLAAAPPVGLMVSLIPWGFALDRFGERRVLLISLSLTVIANACAVGCALANLSYVLLGATLVAGGMASAATNGASGRIVVGWFPAHQRGTAMGVRQTAQPLGIGLCALTIPALSAHHGISAGLWIPLAVSLVGIGAVAVTVIDPPHTAATSFPDRHANPYRRSNYLARIHAVSMLLVIPQTTLWTFSSAWLIVGHHWDPFAAGVVVTVSQLFGAAGRIAAGRWSDTWGSRMKPIRVIAAGAALLSAALALTDWLSSPISVALMVVATVVTVADNGLAFTGIAEYAGPGWSGRALGVQNTGQHFATAALTPALGALISASWAGFPVAFAFMAIAPAVALPLVPADAASADTPIGADPAPHEPAKSATAERESDRRSR